MARGRGKGFYTELDNKSFAQAISRLAAYQFETKEDVRKVVSRSSNRIKDSAKEKCVEDTGETRESIGVKRFDGGLAATIGPRKPLGWRGHFVEFGTSPHAIKTDKKILKGEEGFMGKSVVHPGMQATPFMGPAYDENKQQYLQELRKALEP